MPDNLEFTTIAGNTKHAYDNGLINKHSGIYEAETKDGLYVKGTIKEISEITNIPIMTLYDNTYNKKESRKLKYIRKIR